MAKKKKKTTSKKKTTGKKKKKTAETKAKSPRKEMNRTKLGQKQAQILLTMARGARLVVSQKEGNKRQSVEWEPNTYTGTLPDTPIVNAIRIYEEKEWVKSLTPKTADGVTTTVYALAPAGKAALKAHAEAAKSGGDSSTKAGKKAAKAKAKAKKKKTG